MKHTLSVQNIDVERYSDAYCWAAKATKLDGVNTTQGDWRWKSHSSFSSCTTCSDNNLGAHALHCELEATFSACRT